MDTWKALKHVKKNKELSKALNGMVRPKASTNKHYVPIMKEMLKRKITWYEEQKLGQKSRNVGSMGGYWNIIMDDVVIDSLYGLQEMDDDHFHFKCNDSGWQSIKKLWFK